MEKVEEERRRANSAGYETSFKLLWRKKERGESEKGKSQSGILLPTLKKVTNFFS